MIHLDTHVAVWLYDGRKRLPPGVRALIEAEDLALSPMATFEMSVLREIGRIGPAPQEIVDHLAHALGLRTADEAFLEVATRATDPMFGFTRDPFDRLIAAHAAVAGARLLTHDQRLRDNLDFAVWP